MSIKGYESFEEELAKLLNKHSIDDYMNLPDFVLSRFICAGLNSFINTANDAFHGGSNISESPLMTDTMKHVVNETKEIICSNCIFYLNQGEDKKCILSQEWFQFVRHPTCMIQLPVCIHDKTPDTKKENYFIKRRKNERISQDTDDL